MTFTPGSCDRRRMRLSLMPSARYSFSGSFAGVGEGQDGEGGDALGASAEEARAPEIGGADRRQRRPPRAAASATGFLPATRGLDPSVPPARRWPRATLAKRSAGWRARQRRIVASQRGSRSGTWVRGGGGGSCSRLTAILIGGVAHERPGARDHLVEDDAQRVLSRWPASPARPRPAPAPCRRECPRSRRRRRGDRDRLERSSPELRLARPKSVTTARTSSSGGGRLDQHDVLRS